MSPDRDPKPPATPRSHPPDPAVDPLARAARRALGASHTRDEDEKHPVIGNLRLIGSLAWSILLPTLMGLWLGHWIDGRYATGMLFHMLLMVLGLFVGFGWIVLRLDRLARAESQRIRSQHTDVDSTDNHSHQGRTP